MLNSKLKDDFIAYYSELKSGKPSMIARANQAIKRIGKYEDRWKCDLCEQSNTQKLQELFDDIRGNSSSYICGQLSPLREYCKWTYDIGFVDKIPKFLDIKSPSKNTVIDGTVASPLELQMHLNACFDIESNESIHNIYRAFLWLAFIGFTESQAINISANEVDLINKKITHDGLSFDIYEEGFSCIKNCALLKQFYCDHPQYFGEPKPRPRFDSDLILRGFKSNPGKNLNTECSRAQTVAERDGDISKRLSYKNVWRSGVFYWVFRQEQINNINPDFRGFAIRQWLDSKNYQVEFNPNDSKHKRYVYVAEHGLKVDYNIWKKAHYNL